MDWVEEESPMMTGTDPVVLQLKPHPLARDRPPPKAQGCLEQLSRIRYPSLMPGNSLGSLLICSTAKVMAWAQRRGRAWKLDQS